MAKRGGGCSFVNKVRNMEQLGIAVGIVIDNVKEQNDRIAMSDDGTGGGIRIPSMMISKQDGDTILKWMNTASKEDRANVIVMAEFIS